MRKDKDNRTFVGNPEFYRSLTKYHDASYLRWNRLNDKQQRQIREYELFPDKLNFTLKVFHLLKSQFRTESIPCSINVMALIYDDYRDWASRESIGSQYLSEDRAYNELLFRGFLPLGQVKVRPQRSYVMTSQPVNGKFLIHPFEMGSNYRMTNTNGKGLPYLWHHFHLFGLPGFTRVIYPEMEHYPRLSQKQQIHLKKDWNIA